VQGQVLAITNENPQIPSHYFFAARIFAISLSVLLRFSPDQQRTSGAAPFYLLAMAQDFRFCDSSRCSSLGLLRFKAVRLASEEMY
jgi:hypothetical protein